MLQNILNLRITFDLRVSPVILIDDITDYVGNGYTPSTVQGRFEITSPGGSVYHNNNGGVADISYSGGLNQFSVNCPLDSSNQPQIGSHKIKYSVVADNEFGEFEMSFDLQYIPVEQILAYNFDVFTPELEISDASDYVRGGYTETILSRAWTVDFDVNQITGTNNDINLLFTGNYYDALYDVTLVTDVQYQSSVNTDVFILDRFTINEERGAQTPLKCSELLAQLTLYKVELDKYYGHADPEFERLQEEYFYLATLMYHIQLRAIKGLYTGLETYIADFTRVSRFYVPDPYVYLNVPIQPYSWDCTASAGATVLWTDIINKPTEFKPEAHVHPPFIHNQAAGSLDFTITHSLGFMPDVVALKQSGSSWIPVVVDYEHIDTNNVRILSTVPFVGQILLYAKQNVI